MSAQRLISGGRIDRSEVINFSWDNRQMLGHPGDTLASALLANNQQIIGRSFKYHRPRGIMSAGVEESGAIVTIGKGSKSDPNVKATTQEIYQGLEAYGQNAWPNVRFDLGSISNIFSQFLTAGFYYKTFMGLPPFEWGRGTSIWMLYEKLIRRAAGMGSASKEPDPDSYEHGHIFCDVLIVGSGPAGLSAAATLSELGLDILLVEQDFEPGGDYLNQEQTPVKYKQLLNVIKKSQVRLMTRTTVFGLYDHGTAGLLERVTDHLSDPAPSAPRQRFWTVRSKYTILATGALERNFVFANNDIPGIMTAAAAKTYLHRFGILTGKEIIISTNNDSAYDVSFDLAKAGATVKLLDARPTLPIELSNMARECGIKVSAKVAVQKANGSKYVSNVETSIFDGEVWNQDQSEDCDLVLISGGWNPIINLHSHRGLKPYWDNKNCCFMPDNSHDTIKLVGSAVGVWDLSKCEVSGEAAASSVAKAFGKHTQKIKAPKSNGWANDIQPLYEVKLPGKKQKGFVDPQHDVTATDIRLARQEGFISVEHLKRYTTLGMATDQGKMGNAIGIALMAEALDKNMSKAGTTTFRPPYTPVSIGALAGRNFEHHFRPRRRTPLDEWNLNHDATMTDAGLWQRPWYYARNGETITEAYIREATTTRNSVGLCDVTSLGKIAIQGPDAAEFIDRVYTNSFGNLPIGKARYGIMLRDDGMVLDDGTTWRIGETDYFMTTTTANAAKVLAWLEELLQLRWSNLKVHITSVSEQWAGCAVAGPLSRDVLTASIESPELVSNENLPFMGVLQTKLSNGVSCRIARISFSGEMASEIYVPSDYGPAMMDLLWGKAKPLGGCLYGLEALGTLRIEKGHVTGAELDGRVTIEDAGLGKMASRKKDFIGSVLRQRPAMMDENRSRLVGIFPKNRSQRFNAGAILCAEGEISGQGEGWITGVTYSPVFSHWIGIGFISGGYSNWINKTAIASDPIRKRNIEVEIVSPHMYDPEGLRQYG
jgi:sarcosine oxidase subunit alpha